MGKVLDPGCNMDWDHHAVGVGGVRVDQKEVDLGLRD